MWRIVEFSGSLNPSTTKNHQITEIVSIRDEQIILKYLLLGLFVVLGAILIVIVAIYLFSGSHSLMDYLFHGAAGGFWKQTTLQFVLGFVFIYWLELIVLSFILRLPQLENISKLVLITILMYVSYLVVMAVFWRQGLQSREIFLAEFFIVLFLLITYYKARISLMPEVITVYGRNAYDQLLSYRNVIWRYDGEYPTGLVKERTSVAIDMTVSSNQDIRLIVARLVENGITVYDSRELLENLSGRVELHNVTHDSLVDYEPKKSLIGVKRVFDLIFGIMCIPLALLLTIVIGAIIRLDSKGPIFFAQDRVGYHGARFRLIKFRTMYSGEKEKPKYAVKNDSRITRVGRWLRRYRVDEVPQLLNVLKGDMSLVGPRPEQEYFVKSYEKEINFYGFRHSVRPGITGWAQIKYGYADGSEATRTKLEYDFYYLKKASLWIDLVILASTVMIVLKGSGAR